MFLTGGLNLDILLDRSCIENIPGHTGAGIPSPAVPIEKIAAADGLKPDGAGQPEFWIQVCCGLADPGGLRGQVALDPTDIRTATQRFSRNPDSHGGR